MEDKLREDCFNLGYSFYKWLLERLLVFREELVDLDYYIFEYGGEEYTQGNLIELLIYKLGVILNLDVYSDEYTELGEEIIEIWSIIWPNMVL